MPSGVITLIIVAGSMFALFIIISTVGNYYSLNHIKNKTVGQGQYWHGSLGKQKRDKKNLQAHKISAEQVEKKSEKQTNTTGNRCRL